MRAAIILRYFAALPFAVDAVTTCARICTRRADNLFAGYAAIPCPLVIVVAFYEGRVNANPAKISIFVTAGA